MEDELSLCKKQLENLQAEVEWYKKLYPEVEIFYKKVALAEFLLKVRPEDLKDAPEQPWYNLYLALLEIRLENTPISFMCRQCVNDLMRGYKKLANHAERELAVLGMIQLIHPSELTIPISQHLWSKKMVDDVQAIFWNYYVDSNYTSEEFASYYLSRQSIWRHGKRKMRVAFIIASYVTGDKVLPVYEAMKKRDDIEPFLFLYPANEREYVDVQWNYIHQKYPNDEIYNCTVTDLQKLRPDYVFLPNPYEERRPFYGNRLTDIVKFSKACFISYGATLSYPFAEVLFEERPFFWENLYFHFASAETVKKMMIQRFPRNVGMNYQHVEFLGYPQLKTYYEIEMEPYEARRILWTPRWSRDDKRGGSHFLDYKDNFISLREKCGEKIELFFRPHPDLFPTLQRENLMTKDEIAEYEDTLNENNIKLPPSFMNMDKTIRNIDIFLTDYSSIMICFFLTGRPIIYCEFSNAVPFPEYEEMFAAMYIARSWEDVERHLADLIAGNDPLFDKRQEVAKKIYETHKDATEKIVNRIIEDFNQSLAR